MRSGRAVSKPRRSAQLELLRPEYPSRVKNRTVKVRPILAPLRTTLPPFDVAIDPPLIPAAPVQQLEPRFAVPIDG